MIRTGRCTADGTSAALGWPEKQGEPQVMDSFPQLVLWDCGSPQTPTQDLCCLTRTGRLGPGFPAPATDENVEQGAQTT